MRKLKRNRQRAQYQSVMRFSPFKRFSDVSCHKSAERGTVGTLYGMTFVDHALYDQLPTL